MLLETLHIVNFRSHKNTTVKFQTGTTVIVGDNGSGKSTIIDAILFALSGEKWEKREGLKLDDFIRWNSDGMSVSLTWTADRVKYRVKRGKILNHSTTATLDMWDESSKSWKNLANRQRGVDEKLSEILNLNEIDTSVVRQGDLTKILKQKPSERKEYFHKLLNLEEIEKFYDNFREYVKGYENEASKLSGKISSENETKRKLNEKQKEKEDLEGKRINLEMEKEILEKDVEGKKKLRDEAEAKKDEWQKILSEISLTEKDIKNTKKTIDTKENELKDIEKTEKEIPKLREDAKNFEDLKVKLDEAGKILKLKGQYIFFKDKENEYNKHNSKISELQQAESNYNEVSKQIENLREKISDLKVYDEVVEKLKQEERDTEEKLKECQNYINETEKKYSDLFNEKCELEKIKTIPDKLEKLKKEIDELREKIENFKGREQVLNEALKNLNERKKELNEKIKKAEKDYNETENKKSNLDKYIKETEENYLKIFGEKCDLEKVKNIPVVIDGLKKEIDDLTQQRENFKGKEQELNAMLKNLEKQKNELSEANSVCPVCESPLSDAKKTSLLNKIAEDSKKLVDELKESRVKIKEIELNKGKKESMRNVIEKFINTDLFITRYNERAELNKQLEEIKKDKADKEVKKKEYENEEKEKSNELEKNRNILKNFESAKDKQEKLLKAVEDINTELFLSKYNEINGVNGLNTKINKIKEEKIKADAKKKECEEYNNQLNEKCKIFNELEKKHNEYIYSKKFVESTDINAVKKDIEKISGEISAIIQTQNLPCTIEDVEHYIEETKRQLEVLEKKKDLLSRYEENIKNKDEIIKTISNEKTNYENLLKHKNELTAKITEINYDEKRHKELKNACDDADKKYQEFDKNLSIIKENIKNCENIISETMAELKKIEDAKKEEEILNAFIKFSTDEIREKFGRNGIQKDISKSFFPILEGYVNNLFSTFGFPYDGVEIFEDEVNCNINLKRGKSTISSASLSGGEKSALSIALNAALSKIIGKADFLILDEPTESLDEGKINELIEILKEFKGISQLIVISHDRDFKNAARTRIEIYKEDRISHIVGEENENNRENTDEKLEGENESIKNLTNTQRELFE